MNKKFIIILLFAVVIVSFIAIGGQMKQKKETQMNTKDSAKPTNIMMRTVKLADGGIIFDIPTNLIADRNAVMNGSNLGYDYIMLSSSEQSSTSLSITINRGEYTFGKPHVKELKNQKVDTASDNSVIPTNNLISLKNTKVYTTKVSYENINAENNRYSISAYSQLNLKYTNGENYKTNIIFTCSNNYINQNPTCYTIAKQFLATLQVHEPLSTNIKQITTPATQ